MSPKYPCRNVGLPRVLNIITLEGTHPFAGGGGGHRDYLKKAIHDIERGMEWHSLSCGVTAAPFDRTREVNRRLRRDALIRSANIVTACNRRAEPPRKKARGDVRERREGGREGTWRAPTDKR